MDVRGVGRATIGKNCHFGTGCKVVAAVTIGANVVSANSVVVTDVPSRATVLGAPTRMILREATSLYLMNPVMPLAVPAIPAKTCP